MRDRAENNCTYDVRHTAYSRDSSLGTVTKLYLDDRGIGVQFQAMARDFLFSEASLPAAGPSQPHIEWVRRLIPLE